MRRSTAKLADDIISLPRVRYSSTADSLYPALAHLESVGCTRRVHRQEGGGEGGRSPRLGTLRRPTRRSRGMATTGWAVVCGLGFPPLIRSSLAVAHCGASPGVTQASCSTQRYQTPCAIGSCVYPAHDSLD
eukprot:366193-Chlamydomonas_euryale.AAC.3